mmetsp:Transcript_14605/g.37813  ORF Transcript_14605/g.37813 Transcript_14605/m.37813 type:complete len:133 (-) Transcript_14605:486-884(-)
MRTGHDVTSTAATASSVLCMPQGRMRAVMPPATSSPRALGPCPPSCRRRPLSRAFRLNPDFQTIAVLPASLSGLRMPHVMPLGVEPVGAADEIMQLGVPRVKTLAHKLLVSVAKHISMALGSEIAALLRPDG